MIRLLLPLLLAGAPATADTVVATRTIRAHTLILPEHMTLKPVEIDGAFSDPAAVAGQEARVALYAGRPIREGDVGPPAIVERNQIVSIVFARNGLRIRAEARALGRGAEGDRIRVMNLDSRSSLFGQVRSDGTILVSH